jgi:hypothetical protein
MLLGLAAAWSILMTTAAFADDYFGAPTTRSDEARITAFRNESSAAAPAAWTRSQEARSVASELAKEPPAAGGRHGRGSGNAQ